MKPFRLTSPSLPPLSENDVERQCLDLCKLHGYRIERIHCGKFKTLDGKRYITGAANGTPDYLAVHNFHAGFYLEVKRPGGELRPDQEQRISEIRDGWRIAVAVIDSAAAMSEWLRKHEE